jgi:hypothetical protein
MGHDRQRASIACWVQAVHVAARYTAGRVRPMERLIHGQQMRKLTAIAIDKLIRPGHTGPTLRCRFNRERGIIESERVRYRPITPDRSPHVGRRQDLLRELPYGNGVVVGRRIARSARHRRRNDKRRYELPDHVRGQRPARNLSKNAGPETRFCREVQTCPADAPSLSSFPLSP